MVCHSEDQMLLPFAFWEQLTIYAQVGVESANSMVAPRKFTVLQGHAFVILCVEGSPKFSVPLIATADGYLQALLCIHTIDDLRSSITPASMEISIDCTTAVLMLSCR